MSDYSKITNFTAKDALASGAPGKVALGADVDAELAAIATMSASKENLTAKGAANGYCPLTGAGLVDRTDLPGAVSYVDTAETYTKGKGTTPVVLTDGATITVDATLGNVYTVTLGGNRTMAAPTGPLDGQTISIYVTQDGTGSRTLTWNAAFKFAGATPPTLSASAGKVDLFTMQYRAATTFWYVVTSGLNFG